MNDNIKLPAPAVTTSAFSPDNALVGYYTAYQVRQLIEADRQRRGEAVALTSMQRQMIRNVIHEVGQRSRCKGDYHDQVADLLTYIASAPQPTEPSGAITLHNAAIEADRNDRRDTITEAWAVIDELADDESVMGLSLASAIRAVIRQARGEPVIPKGFRLIAVNETFDSLMYWLDRCEQKGHLENCADLTEPWGKFEYREVEAPQPADPVVEKSLTVAEPDDEEVGIYEDVYEQITDMIEPYVQREYINPNGTLPASVVGATQMMLDHWIKKSVEPVKVPSDIELDDLADDFHGYAGNYTRHGYPIPKFNHVGYARAILKSYAASQPQQIPEGYKMVPVEPDWNMEMSGIQKLLPCTDGELECLGEKLLDSYREEVSKIYRAMLEALPEPKEPK